MLSSWPKFTGRQNLVLWWQLSRPGCQMEKCLGMLVLVLGPSVGLGGTMQSSGFWDLRAKDRICRASVPLRKSRVWRCQRCIAEVARKVRRRNRTLQAQTAVVLQRNFASCLHSLLANLSTLFSCILKQNKQRNLFLVQKWVITGDSAVSDFLFF